MSYSSTCWFTNAETAKAVASTRDYIATLKAHLSNNFRYPSSSFSREFSALLSKALKRCIILIDNAVCCSPEGWSNMFSKFPPTLPIPELNEGPVSKQNTESDARFTPIFENFGWMDPTTSPSYIKYNLDRFKNSGHYDDASKSSWSEEPSYGSIPSLSFDGASFPLGKGQLNIQQNPSQSDDQLRSNGDILALSYVQDRETPKAQSALAAWICKISLAGDEHSVSYNIHSKRLANSC